MKSSNFLEKIPNIQFDRERNFTGGSCRWTTSYLTVLRHESAKTDQASYIYQKIFNLNSKIEKRKDVNVS